LTSDAKVWLRGSDAHQGSWWTDVGLWLDEQCGTRRPAPKALGSNRLSVLAEAPGTYVFDK
jgi:polyhydroxyalkanoate synthase